MNGTMKTIQLQSTIVAQKYWRSCQNKVDQSKSAATLE